ncbi:MAG TPA: serine/threonine-protein kinase [Polyangia bacterium]|jgi:serine/threonine protein kinase
MKYRLLEKIGSGGMAEVFRASGEGPEGFERPFVIKRIHPRLSEAPEFIRMFVDEARLSARLVHPNIVQVLEFVHQDGIYYIVMERVDGVDMGRVLQRMAQQQGRLSPLFCAEVARQVCRGLEFAHALTRADGQPAGVVHRDVTPPNIMVDWNGTVRILDFGLARAMQDLQASAAEAGTIRGKMSYVAPELLEGQAADARTDVFSLAVVLHELLSGRRMFLGENDLETLKLVRDMPMDPPSARNPAVKAALDEIVMRGLARNPAKRYQSAREMGDDLEEFVVRRQFSTRALAEMARELFLSPGADQAGEPEAIPPAGEPPVSVGQADSVIVLEGAAERRHRPTPSPPPAAAVLTAQPASEPNVAQAPARSGFRLSAAASFTLVGLCLLSVLGALFVAVSARRALTAGVLSANGPARPGGDAPGTLPETVRVTLDSVPQGATVARAGVSLGQTPLVLSLARGDAPVELVLTRASFTPFSFRVIANRDKDATATLEREAPPAPVVSAAAPSEETPRARRKRRAAARAEAAAVAAASTPAAAPAAPSPTARPAAQSPVRAALPAIQPTRPVALVPGPGVRR